ncbi:MAG: glycosyltransferase family 2 protein [Terriglobales bacterium]
MKITARINTFNEADHIAAALESVAWADERLVLDSYSTDGTADIARQRGARVEQHEFRGYGEKHNHADSLCSHEWVLALDADERVTPQLREAVLALRTHGPKADAYRMARRTWYLDRWIRHSGWYPDYQTRLYRRAVTRWAGEPPHEAPKVQGRVTTLPGDLLHFTRRNLREHLEVMNHYTDMAATARAEAGRRPSWARLWLAPPWTFVRSYLLRQGFRDGRPGLILAYLAANYVLLKEAKLLERYRAVAPPEAGAGSAPGRAHARH